MSPLVGEFCLFIMYCGSPFYSYPHKLMAAICFSSPYPRAFRHFSDAHSQPLNIGLHLFGLAHAVATNSALVLLLDHSLFDGLFGVTSFLSIVNVLLWVSLLLCCTDPAPAVVRLLAASVVVLGYLSAPLVLDHWLSLLWAEGIVHALNYKYGDAKAVPTIKRCPFLVCLLGRYILQWILSTYAASVLAAYTLPINCIVLLLAIHGSHRPFSKVLNCYWAGYYGWIVAILTGQPWLYLYGAGFTASLFQGVSHEWSGEAANLPELATRTGKERCADEIAHVTYFPVLAFHVAHKALGF